MIDWLIHWATVHYDPGAFSWHAAPGYVGALLIVASFVVRTMIPLRTLSAGSNLCIIVYAYFDAQYPTLALNTALLPLNILRLAQMMKLVRRVPLERLCQLAWWQGEFRAPPPMPITRGL